MNMKTAISIIESASGFTERYTPVGEAWEFVLAEIERLRGERDEAKAAVDSALAALKENTADDVAASKVEDILIRAAEAAKEAK